MLGALTDKMRETFSRLMREKKLTEDNISEAVSEVRLALLEADVNYSVAKAFVKKVKDRTIGEKVVGSVTAGQQFIKLVHDELVQLMGGEEHQLNLSAKPAVILMCGLQGAGKTTHTAKLARYLRKQNLAKNPLVAACDLQRPAAVEQLKTLATASGAAFFSIPGETDPLKVAKAAHEFAKTNQHDVLIVDTAGRLQIDAELMNQLASLKKALNPGEVIFVANATTGQDAVNVAAEFNEKIGVTGSILTMLDGNTRGGAAISIREVTGKPLLFEGIGEKIDDIQLFNPKSMADRILGMGDTINLVKKAQEHITEEDAKRMEEKLRSAAFTYEDFLSQLQMVKKMGSLKGLMGMLPGMSQLKDLPINEKDFFKTEAIIYSMTKDERAERCEMTPPRRKRLAAGSGTSIEDVNKLVKSFKQAKQFFKNMPNMKQLQKMMGGSLWR
jgi:signal recognition particle subunit SRP54